MFVENVKWFLKFKENIYVTLLLVNNRASVHRENIYVTLLLVNNRDSIHRLTLDPYNISTFDEITHLLRLVD